MNLREQEERIQQLINQGQMSFFIGPSFSLEAGLPYPSEIMKMEIDSLFTPFPEYQELIEKFKSRLQPEVFHESLLYVTDRKDLLGLHKIYDHTFLWDEGIKIEAQNIHQHLVDYSLRTGLPLLTTNTDTLLELACITSSYNYKIITFKGNDLQENSVPLTDDKDDFVRIVKINGSASEVLDNIHWTLYELHNTNKGIIEYVSMCAIFTLPIPLHKEH